MTDLVGEQCAIHLSKELSTGQTDIVSVKRALSSASLCLMSTLLQPLVGLVWCVNQSDRERLLPRELAPVVSAVSAILSVTSPDPFRLHFSVAVVESFAGSIHMFAPWKKEVIKLFISRTFFCCDLETLSHWRTVNRALFREDTDSLLNISDYSASSHLFTPYNTNGRSVGLCQVLKRISQS